MALLSSLPSLVANTVATVILRGLVEDEAGSPMTLHLIRTPPEAQDGLRFYDPTQSVRILPEMPARPPSSLPEPGDAVLDITVAGQLGQGRVGTVHIADVRSCSVPVDIPPLVVKVANRDFCDNLSKEAWMYEEMESLQGVAIPRCYGYSVSEIPPHTKVLGWDRVATTKLPISILLLERVGGHLPLGKPIPQTVQDDLWRSTKDFGELHIFDKGLRYDNVLFAPDSPPGLPSLVSPFSHRSYVLRVVDFDLGYKVNLPPQSLDFHHKHLVRLILDNVPRGNVVNPFDD